MRLKNKPWAKPFIEVHPDLVIDEASFRRQLDEVTTPVYLEIGSGKGQFLITMGSRHPENTYFGVERVLVPVAIAGRKLLEEALVNVHFVHADITFFLGEIKERSFDGIYLNFSDPWPKKRHEKRRLTSDNCLDQYARILKPGGFLALKTDNRDFFEYSAKNLLKHGYNIISSADAYVLDEENDAMTEYETAFRALGQPIYRLVIRKE
ncbi:MAG: tRNA (guanosine(46)-N7)-methyltransferase TrmB [Bacilli bacterium]|jgi:tRNA (guanine-N7-)-methyltransferase